MRKVLFLVFALLTLGTLVFAQSKETGVKVGQKVPNFTLTNQNSKTVNLTDFKGKVVLITFLYTQCPFPDKCPMLAQKLDRTRDLLDQVQGAKDRFQVLSITLDPKRDTPEALKKYAQGHDGDANWTFLTGKASDISKIASMFGMIYYTEQGIIDHNMRTVVIDGNQRLRKVYAGSKWTPAEVAAVVKDLVAAR